MGAGRARVAASARISFPERIATSEALMGQRLPVEVKHAYRRHAGIREWRHRHTVITSFDVWGHKLPNIEIHGTEMAHCPCPTRITLTARSAS